jgi:hypothetical protein
MLRRRLFMTLSLGSLLLAILVSICWIRSYWSSLLWGRTATDATHIREWGVCLERSMFTVFRSTMLDRQPVPGRSEVEWRLYRIIPDRGANLDLHTLNWSILGTRQYSFNSGPDLSMTHIEIPTVYPFLATLLIPAWHVIGIYGQRRRVRLGLCPHCGYDLRGSPQRCPECGRPKDQPHRVGLPA